MSAIELDIDIKEFIHADEINWDDLNPPCENCGRPGKYLCSIEHVHPHNKHRNVGCEKCARQKGHCTLCGAGGFSIHREPL